jgi:hypothetical protein
MLIEYIYIYMYMKNINTTIFETLMWIETYRVAYYARMIIRY